MQRYRTLKKTEQQRLDDSVQRWELRMISTTVGSLFNIMRPAFHNFPNDYVVIDLETTGIRFHKGSQPFFPTSDLITQFGYCLVKDCKVVQQGASILNWYTVPEVDANALTERMRFTKQVVENKNGAPTGKKYHMTPELMQTGGNPIELLSAFKEYILDGARSNKMFFVAHNGYHFDARMITEHFAYWLKQKFVFDANEIFDTGMLEKASQCNTSIWQGDTLKDWSYRVYKARLKNVRWSLDKACVARYKLADRHYLPLDLEGRLEAAHDASFDSYLTHLLFEEYKEIASGRRIEPPIPYRSL